MRETHDCSIDTLFARSAKDNVPLSIEFELTYRCNLHCGHCYVVDRGEEELSFSEIAGILDQLAAANCLFLTLTGGEVFIREDFLDIARYTRSQGFALKIFTNGNLINKDIACEMARLKPLQVGISLYGADAATHDRLTGVHGSFHRSINALRLFKEQGIMTTVKCLLMKENLAQLGEIRTLAGEMGAIFQFDPVVTPRSDGNRAPLQHELTEAELYGFFSHEVADPGKSGERAYPLSESIICGAGRDICSISPGGEVYACVALPMSLGNLRQSSFEKIWHGAEATKLRRFRFSDLHQCVSCHDVNYCIRCWGLATVESGDHLGPAYSNCRIARIRHRISDERSKSKTGGGL